MLIKKFTLMLFHIHHIVQLLILQTLQIYTARLSTLYYKLNHD